MNGKFWFTATLLVVLFASSGNADAAGADQMIFDGINSPTGMVCAPNGSLYVSEWSSGRIAKIQDGKISIILNGLQSPAGLAFDDAGNLYIAGYGDGNIYIWDGKGRPRVLASDFSAPTGLLWSKDKNLLVANRNAGEVVAIHAGGKKKVLSRGHTKPVGLAQTEDGRLFVSCYGGSVDVISPDGEKLSISTGLEQPGVGIVPAGCNSVYVVDYARGHIAHVNSSGLQDIVAKGLSAPVALATTPDGNLMVGCWGDNALHLITIKE